VIGAALAASLFAATPTFAPQRAPAAASEWRATAPDLQIAALLALTAQPWAHDLACAAAPTAAKLTGNYCEDTLILHDHPALAGSSTALTAKGEAKVTLKLVNDVGVACQ
jgi:hypothetical protein